MPERSGPSPLVKAITRRGQHERHRIDRRVAGRDHADRDRRSWYWAPVEALASAGAALDPAAALAATRLARIREQELGRG